MSAAPGMHTVEAIGAGHMWSKHLYTQWFIRKPNGRDTVDTRGGDVRRFDSEAAANSTCKRLNP